jgi:aryl-alcohol dehydrogenase-like predicted oxidoreductase
MEYRTLSQTDLKVSRLAFGTLTFGSQSDEPNARRFVDRCLDGGINFFDTANVYNEGQAETILGRVLAGRRQRVVLATKGRGKMGEGPDESGLSRAALLRAINESLKRLQTDYIDLYYMHMPDYNVPIVETLAAMNEAVRAGKVRHPAVSNYAAWQVCEILWIADKKGFKPPTITQPMYNLLARGIEEEYLAFCKRFRIAVVTYNPLAGGLLTGKHANESQPVPGTRFDRNTLRLDRYWSEETRLYLERYWHEDYFAAVEELRVIAREAGRTLVELAFQWLLSQEQVDSIIMGASRLEQLEDNLKACDGKKLDGPTLARCDAVWKRLRGITPKYNR